MKFEEVRNTMGVCENIVILKSNDDSQDLILVALGLADEENVLFTAKVDEENQEVTMLSDEPLTRDITVKSLLLSHRLVYQESTDITEVLKYNGIDPVEYIIKMCNKTDCDDLNTIKLVKSQYPDVSVDSIQQLIENTAWM